MKLLKFTDEHNAFRERLRNFLEQEVVPLIDGCERRHSTPRSMWKAMGSRGFLCPCIPEEYGGQGLDFLYSVIIGEELAKISFTGLAAPLHSDIIVPYIQAFGTEAQKKKYLPGCASGDIITAVDDNPVDEEHSLSQVLQGYKPGDTVEIVEVKPLE